MVDLLARGTIDFANFELSLRPAQVTVLAREGGTLFCDDDAEQMAFDAD